MCFLEKSEEFAQQNLFRHTNKKLGTIEIIFRSGEKYDSDEEDIFYRYNKQIFRLDTYDYNPDYMNRYKRIVKKYPNYLESIGDCISETGDCISETIGESCLLECEPVECEQLMKLFHDG